MPHLQREREDLLKQAEKIAGQSDNEGQTALPQKRRGRNSAHLDNVILSSKFVVESIRDRLDEGEDPSFWTEFPRGDGDALEKRGIEILADPVERPPRKYARLETEKSDTAQNIFLLCSRKITVVKVAEPASISRPVVVDFPQKRNAKGKLISAVETIPILSPPLPDRGPTYHLAAKDLEWLDIYNNFCAEKKWPKLSPQDLEGMITSLDIKKNELILAHLKSEISAANKTSEGSAKRHEKDYFVLQKFIAYTPNTFDQLDHLNLGRSFGLTTQTAFDIWEYWKLKLQDSFYQPIIFPPANLFDYRRISMLAAWNMTTVNFAQRLRHDAERIRLMYDLLQKRNHVTIKSMAKEEELTLDLAELCIHPEAKCLPPDLLNLVMHYMNEMAPYQQPQLEGSKNIGTIPTPDPLREWMNSHVLGSSDSSATSEDAAAPSPSTITPNSPEIYSKVSSRAHSIKPVIFPPLELKPAPNIRVNEEKTAKDAVKLGQRKSRLTRGRSDGPKNMTFEHADNSCCENGPIEDEEDLMPVQRRTAAGSHTSSFMVKEEASVEEEPLYMINNLDDSGVVLQEIYPPLKAAEFRSRLRSWKRVA